jgi:hypothetical protein
MWMLPSARRAAHRFGANGGRVKVAALARRYGKSSRGAERSFGDPSLELFGAKEYLRHHPIGRRLNAA